MINKNEMLLIQNLLEESYDRKGRFEKFFENTIDNIYFFLTKLKNDKWYLVVRGSDNRKNWLLDFDYLKTYDKEIDIFVHLGFKKASKNIFFNVLPILKRLEIKNLTICGHSLGGAISHLLNIRLTNQEFNVKSIGFGSPKFTNWQGANFYSQLDITNIINDNDIVCSTPPNTILGIVFGRYWHTGEQIILLDNGEASFNPTWKVLKKNHTLLRNIDFESISEHKLKNYRKKIENYNENTNFVDHHFKG
jgi:hypothetical protein